jgi:hypothetical protein
LFVPLRLGESLVCGMTCVLCGKLL